MSNRGVQTKYGLLGKTTYNVLLKNGKVSYPAVRRLKWIRIPGITDFPSDGGGIASGFGKCDLGFREPYHLGYVRIRRPIPVPTLLLASRTKTRCCIGINPREPDFHCCSLVLFLVLGTESRRYLECFLDQALLETWLYSSVYHLRV